MSETPSGLPCPPLPIRVDVPGDGGDLDLRTLPARPGVFAFEDTAGRTIAMAITANVRRLVRSRLAAPDPSAGPSRRADYRSVTRTVRAMTVGSAFEADWAYLQLARRRLPTTYRTLLDRWRGWFVHADVDAPFPRFVKVSTADAGTFRGVSGTMGPFVDKQTAQRAIEMIEDAFDLCRYHHILLEAPHGTACAYKEMGRCPAPCDGSIRMDVYRATMREACGFLADPQGARAGLEHRMREASAALDFETAAHVHRRHERTAFFSRAGFRFVGRLDRFRFLAVLPGEHPGHARLMLVHGGRIEPWADIPLAEPARLLCDALDAAVSSSRADLSVEAIQNVGLVCWHLFRPARSASGAPGAGELIPVDDEVPPAALAAALRRLGHRADTSAGEVPDTVIDEV